MSAGHDDAVTAREGGERGELSRIQASASRTIRCITWPIQRGASPPPPLAGSPKVRSSKWRAELNLMCSPSQQHDTESLPLLESSRYPLSSCVLSVYPFPCPVAGGLRWSLLNECPSCVCAYVGGSEAPTSRSTLRTVRDRRILTR